MRRHAIGAAAFDEEAKSLGFPIAFKSGALAPFDIVSDFLRGMRGTMLDMYRRPEKLLTLIDKLANRFIPMYIGGAKMSGHPGVFIALHRGSDGFMSLKQFETFYWPTLKKMVLALIDADLTPWVFFEGDHTSRLPFYAEFPKGKVVGLFDETDPVEAKRTLGNTMCMSGMMPASLLQFGTPDEVKGYAKKLIDTVGKDGGYIMAPKSVMDEANPALVKVWMDFTKEYGVYR